MYKKCFACMLALSFVFQNKIVAQQSNFSEDFSSYLPEIKSLNKKLLLANEPPPILQPLSKPIVKNIKGPGGDLPLRIFKPGNIRGVVLEIHGGGWTFGAAADNDFNNDLLSKVCSVAVVSVDYRLASQAAFPACLEDCKASAKWLVENALKEFGTEKIFISGGSSGAHLSALTLLYVRDSLHAIDKVKGVNLMYGCFDISRTPSLRQTTDSTPILSKTNVDATFEFVFGKLDTKQLQNPANSPLYANLKGLPPALFTVGTADPVIDDSFFMESRWRVAGNKTFLAVYPECPHAFNYFPVEIAAVANRKIQQWIIEQYSN
ncbi:MAG: alpha/beta hydrolase fold domain-containing protein [Bacteroidetes bacterium]|nr:alpha/beta hydrolase fold domain-containing protein [Bacteroidota bacterium]